MKRPEFLLDSGAFSVWSRGRSIDLDRYIEFCADYPEIDYYVALDVIPGSPGVSPKPSDIEKACVGGWKNYKHMLRRLPIDKVIPVFHQHDSFDWLEKYRDFGTPYIGISPANDQTTDSRLRWLDRVKQYICDSEGNPRMKTHGFAVTSFRLMNYWHWTSVDSASWARVAATGCIYVPVRAGDYSRSPLLIGTSPRSPTAAKLSSHLSCLSPMLRERVMEYLAEQGEEIGEWEVRDRRGPNDKPEKRKELWADGKRSKILVLKKSGVATDRAARFRVNRRFCMKMMPHVNVDRVFFAGNLGGVQDSILQIEMRLAYRLMSFFDIFSSKRLHSVVDMWLRRRRDYEKK